MAAFSGWKSGIGNFKRYKGDNMNHKAMARGALALTLGFLVGTACAADVQKYGATFEPYEKDLAGMMNVEVGDSVANLTPKAIPAENLVVDPEDPGWAIITIPNAAGCFFRARVDFEAAETALTPVSTGE